MFLFNATIFHLLLGYTPFRFEYLLLFVQSLVLAITYTASKYWAFAKKMDIMHENTKSP